MRIVAIAAVLFGMVSVAEAGPCNFNGCAPGWGHHGHGGYRGHHGGGGGGDWAAPLIGGLIIGGMLGAMSQPHYQEAPQYRYMPPRRCEIRDYFDEYGNWVNREKVCW